MAKSLRGVRVPSPCAFAAGPGALGLRCGVAVTLLTLYLYRVWAVRLGRPGVEAEWERPCLGLLWVSRLFLFLGFGCQAGGLLLWLARTLFCPQRRGGASILSWGRCRGQCPYPPAWVGPREG